MPTTAYKVAHHWDLFATREIAVAAARTLGIENHRYSVEEVTIWERHPKVLRRTVVKHDGRQVGAEFAAPLCWTDLIWEGESHFEATESRRYPVVDYDGHTLTVQALTESRAWEAFRAEARKRGLPYFDPTGG